MFKSMKKLSALLLSFLMVFSLFSGVQVKAASDQVKINILATSDLHGRFTAWDYPTDTANTAGNLAQIATLVKEKRAANPNTIVVDNGDTIQDNSNQIFLKDDINPMILAMNEIGYDTWTLGNHEFNYGVPALERSIANFKGKVLAGNVYKPDGSRLAAPYTIIEKGGVKAGIIGMTNPNITKWDAANLEKYKATSPVDEVKKAVAELKGKVDVMIGVIHVGPTPEYNNDDGADLIAKACPELAAIVAGHAHLKVADKVENNVLIMEPNKYGDNVIDLEITLTKGSDGKFTVVNKSTDVKGSLILVKDYKADADLVAKLQPYDDRAKTDARTVIGKLTGGDLVPANEVKGIPTAQIQDTAMIDLINDVQMYYTGADISAAAAFSTTANIKAGDITKAGTSQIYMYDNTLYKMEITGKQLKQYMEWSASFYNTYNEGDLTISFNEKVKGYNYDMFSGVNYNVDISKPSGYRIVNLTKKDGTPIKDTDVFIMAVNNYRANTQLLTEGAIYKTKADMPKLLERDVKGDIGGVRELIKEYIEKVKGGTITPALDNNWKVVGNNWNAKLRETIVKMVNEDKIKLPASADGRTQNVKALNAFDLMANGTIPDYKVIDILTINDFHGSLKQDGKNVGIANLVGEIKKAKEANPNTVFVGAGDLFQGSAESNLLYGKPVTEALKEAGIVASAIGNHEYDWGVGKIEGWAKDGGFEFLAANIYDKTTNKPVSYAKPYKIVDIGGVKVAFIGIATPETAYKTKPEIVENVEFKDPATILPTYIAKVREEGAKFVVALTHLGAAQDNKTGVITGEAANITKVPGLDAVIAGHTHLTVAGKVNNVPVVEAYYNGRTLGKIRFAVNKSTNELFLAVAVNDELYNRSATLTADAAVKTMYEKYSKDIQPILSEKIGVVKVDMIKDNNTPNLLGEWSADLMRKVAGTQIGIQNGGGLRVSIEKGDLTVGKMYEFMPFDNTLVTVDLTGAQLKEAIENGIKNEKLGTAFGQIAGVYAKYDLSKPFGERVLEMALENGDKIDPNKLYSVVTNDFMITGGDGYSVLGKGKNIKDTAIPIRDAMVEYIKKNPTVAPEFKNYQRTTDLPFASTSVTEPTTEPATKPTAAVVEYIVKPGDVLWRIAEKYGTTYKQVGEYNKLKNLNLIYVGQKLLIPAN